MKEHYELILHKKKKCLHSKVIKGLLKLITFFLILFVCIFLTNEITKRKGPYYKFEDFFSQEQDFDVLFFGSSHMLNGVYPMELWKRYGIISYNMGNESERLTATYYNIQLSLQYTKPKLIVVDAFIVKPNEKVDKKKDKLHKTLDAYPISSLKYKAVKDLFDNQNLLEREVEFLFPFSMYHSRWDELLELDFKKEVKCEKGATTIVNVAEPIETANFDTVGVYSDEETINMQYLRKIIEYCKENNIDILITYLPHTATEEYVAHSKYIQTICDEYSINYLNFLKESNVINKNTDFKDSSEINSHLNPSGARKLADYLGKYIQENYNIPDQRNNETFNFWDEDYDKYVQFKINNFENHEKELNNYLMLLYDDKEIDYQIKISSKKVIENESVLQKLLENLNNNYEIDDEVFKENKDKTVKITTWDNRTGELIKEVWF